MAATTQLSTADAGSPGPFGWIDNNELYCAMEAAVDPQLLRPIAGE